MCKKRYTVLTVNIRYTKHAQKKFQDLEELGVHITKRLVRSILTQPKHTDTTSDTPKTIVSGMLDTHHLLRIVYRKEHDTILVITFYPATVGRYSV